MSRDSYLEKAWSDIMTGKSHLAVTRNTYSILKCRDIIMTWRDIICQLKFCGWQIKHTSISMFVLILFSLIHVHVLLILLLYNYSRAVRMMYCKVNNFNQRNDVHDVFSWFLQTSEAAPLFLRVVYLSSFSKNHPNRELNKRKSSSSSSSSSSYHLLSLYKI